MTRATTVHKLPEWVRNELERKVFEDLLSIDLLTEWLRGLEPETGVRISRSAIGRHVKRLREYKPMDVPDLVERLGSGRVSREDLELISQTLTQASHVINALLNMG